MLKLLLPGSAGRNALDLYPNPKEGSKRAKNKELGGIQYLRLWFSKY